MKREGRPHGLIRCHEIEMCYPKGKLYKTDFAKLSSKPTNHSKFTGKCPHAAHCPCSHHRPWNKAKDKRKGAHKTKNDGGGVFSLKAGASYSATGMLNRMEEEELILMGYGNEHWIDEIDGSTDGVEIPAIGGIGEQGDDTVIGIGIGIVDDMGFHEVGFVCYQIEEEDEENWYFVEEM